MTSFEGWSLLSVSSDCESGESDFRALIEQAQRGCSVSLGKLMDNCRAYLLLVANQSLDETLRAKLAPSDIVHEAYIKAVEGVAEFRGQTEIEWRVWLGKILVRQCQDARRRFLRSEKRDVRREIILEGDHSHHALLSQKAGTHDTPSKIVSGDEEDQQLLRAVDGLPERQRDVVRLRVWEDLDFVEIAERLGTTETAARKAWFRAIQSLTGWEHLRHDQGTNSR
jgi:RNA polymerase sigma-70 factor (ECF subfamily)